MREGYDGDDGTAFIPTMLAIGWIIYMLCGGL